MAKADEETVVRYIGEDEPEAVQRGWVDEDGEE